MPILQSVPHRHVWRVLLVLLAPGLLAAQSPSTEIRQILDRLDRLEQENRSLAEEVHQLRQQLATARGTPPETAPPETGPPLEEKVALNESRVEELAQTKVEASQRFPIRVTGMALFNTFLNSKGSAGLQYPTFAWFGNKASAGATVYQTTIGLEYSGPRTFLDGKVSGSVFMDFAAESERPLDLGFRLRTGDIRIDWKNTSVMAGVESPIFAPREPASLAQVEVAPLTAAGNLWLWMPQARIEQRIPFTEQTGIRAQLGVVETSEVSLYQEIPQAPEENRPGLEGRVEFYHGLGEGRRFEIAPGFHTSITHLAGQSVSSKLFSLDWFTNPLSKLEFTGAFFSGQNTVPVGGLEGVTIRRSGTAIPVHSDGGWAQLTIQAAPRLSFHIFSGLEKGRTSDLSAYSIGRNWVYGANLYYRLAPNVLLGLETSQARTAYIDSSVRLNNHYDLALAYLF